MTKIMRFLLTVLIAASGCTLTLNSIFTPKDVTYDTALEGLWQNDEANWTIKGFDKKTGRYELQATMNDQQQAEFYATLGTIGTNRFLELTPKRPDAIHAKTFFGGHFISLHSFWKVELDADKLTLTSMSTQWLEMMIKQKKTDIKYEKSDGGILFLTASTQELREFVDKYVNDPGAFPARGDEKGIVFIRSNRIPQQNSLPSGRAH